MPYTGEHVHIRICPACGDTLDPPPSGCAICWHGPDHGLLVTDDQTGLFVHQHCFDFFGVDDQLQFERMYIDRLD